MTHQSRSQIPKIKEIQCPKTWYLNVTAAVFITTKTWRHPKCYQLENKNCHIHPKKGTTDMCSNMNKSLKYANSMIFI